MTSEHANFAVGYVVIDNLGFLRVKGLLNLVFAVRLDAAFEGQYFFRHGLQALQAVKPVVNFLS